MYAQLQDCETGRLKLRWRSYWIGVTANLGCGTSLSHKVKLRGRFLLSVRCYGIKMHFASNFWQIRKIKGCTLCTVLGLNKLFGGNKSKMLNDDKTLELKRKHSLNQFKQLYGRCQRVSDHLFLRDKK